MGRAPCCDKANVKKGPWSPEEDAKLKSYIDQHGTGGNWIALPQKIGLKRCGKSCRLRWLNYLRPNIKHGGFSEEEDNIICSLYISIGSRWSIIAAQLPGRTDNDIKNYWNTRLKKKLLGKQRKDIQRDSSARSRNRKQNQDMIMRIGRENSNHILSSSTSSDNNINDQNNPYYHWPELPTTALLPVVPIPYSNDQEQPRFNNNNSDHASIRKLLIKLGGRFSTDDDQPINSLKNLQYNYPTVDNSSSLVVQPMDVISSAPMDVLNTCNSNSLPDMDMSMLTPQGINFSSELEQMIYKNPQKFDGLEFLCGDIMMNNYRINIGGGSSASWGEMSSLVLPSVVGPSFEGQQQQAILDQDCAGADDHLRYTAGA